jgi:cation:H+ antiporter
MSGRILGSGAVTVNEAALTVSGERRHYRSLVFEPSLPPDEAQRAAVRAIWTFPSVLGSAFVLAWGAEAAQYYVSQGLALAILAWLQVMPEFAVEAVIAWHRDVPLMTANFTGALRLLTGLGWPVIWLVHAFARRGRGERGFWRPIELEPEHSVEVAGLVPPLLYWAWIIYKGSLDLVDAGVLGALYVAYLIVLNRIPPKEHEELADVAAVPRAVIQLRPWPRRLVIVGLFLIGGSVLYLVAHPFLDSMIGLASVVGISQFVFVQWVAPFLSEFPEFVTTSYWARGRGKAGMALMNMASSNINQWTMLAAMIPIVYSLSLGHAAPVPLAEHRVELMLTLIQGTLGIVLLSNLNFQAYEALGLLALWFVQFCVPHWREEVSLVYAAWLAFEVASALWRPHRLRVFRVFVEMWAQPASRR